MMPLKKSAIFTTKPSAIKAIMHPATNGFSRKLFAAPMMSAHVKGTVAIMPHFQKFDRVRKNDAMIITNRIIAAAATDKPVTEKGTHANVAMSARINAHCANLFMKRKRVSTRRKPIITPKICVESAARLTSETAVLTDPPVI